MTICERGADRARRSQRAVRLGGVAAALVLLLVAVGCEPAAPQPVPVAPSAPQTTAPRPTLEKDSPRMERLPPAEAIQAYQGAGARVVVFGDSLAYGTTEASIAELSAFSLSWNTWGSTTWDDYAGAARSVVASDAAVAVVALGTNDLWDGWSLTDQIELDRFLKALGSPPCTVLVGYASGGPVLDIFHEPNLKYPAAEQAGNEALAAAAAQRTAAGAPTVVGDWGAAAAAVPGTYAWDNVHHTDLGDQTWAVWMRTELERVTTGPCA
ncbi:hypothetical protein [Aquihabitans sp. McL0605]|uniref:hypothetical protein n=1 Tax=Aquihabitans sp. McL0605 TaxID=3415671 RepID=UPI003CF879E8